MTGKFFRKDKRQEQEFDRAIASAMQKLERMHGSKLVKTRNEKRRK